MDKISVILIKKLKNKLKKLNNNIKLNETLLFTLE